MKLGELKLEALMLISPLASLRCDTSSEDELAGKITELMGDSNYSDYLAAMPGAFNRCFTSLESKGLVPFKSYEIEKERLCRKGACLCFGLDKIADLGKVVNVYCYSEHSSPCKCEYSYLGRELLIRDYYSGTFIIEYMPRITRITNISSEAEVIELDEDVCALIPYFIKSELLRAENEQEAAVARNIYEQMANEIPCKYGGYQTSVESVYEVGI